MEVRRTVQSCYPQVLALCLLGLVIGVLVSCADPTTRWAQARLTLTTAQDLVGELHQQGKIDDEALVEIDDRYVQPARAALDTARLHLPDGGQNFNRAIDIAEAAIREIMRRQAAAARN